MTQNKMTLLWEKDRADSEKNLSSVLNDRQQTADDYTQAWLTRKGYKIIEKAVFDDCIGYRCERKEKSYKIFMYGRDARQSIRAGGAFYNKLAQLNFAASDTVLILYIDVERYADGDETKYRICNCRGGEVREPELWQMNEVEGRYILQYYPSQEMIEQVWQLMYAFNREDTDIYDCIVIDDDPMIKEEGDRGWGLNSVFYGRLFSMHRQYGDMKLGYVCFDDMTYSVAPYIEGFGFFRWYSSGGRISRIICQRFDDEERKATDFIKTEQREPNDLFDYIPKLIGVVPLLPTMQERFAVKLFFDNRECRKYVLPIDADDMADEAIAYGRYVFSDGIWRSVRVVPEHASRHDDYPRCGPAIMFKNTFSIAGTRCYLESKPYSG